MNIRKCRNCGSDEIIVTGNALLAPFFSKRVHGLEPISIGRFVEQNLQFSHDPIKTFIGRQLLRIRSAPLVTSFFKKRVFCLQAQTRACASCGFVGPDQEYTDEMLSKLYVDYRSESYDEERCSFEPSYREIASLIGKSESEIKARHSNMNAIIEKCVDTGSVRTVLDWGGGDGRFVPTKLLGKEVTVLDISSEPTVADFIRVEALKDEDSFDYIQVCHVLEHVGNPRYCLKKIVEHLRPGGYLYIEVPKDRCDADLTKFIDDPSSVTHLLHEHINIYSARAVSELAASVGLNKLEIREADVDCGWTKARVICGVFRKPSTC
jgi:SAM-dependent methyltransferase